MPKSLKDPTTYTEQLARFQSRNMVVDDEAKALLDLRACNYYRVCGYCYQFFNAKGNYKNGTSFEVVMRIYHFDSRLRHILLIPLESAEIYARTMIAYGFSHNYGSAGHYEKSNFRSETLYQTFWENMHDQIEKNKDSLIVSHHKENYDGKMPLWAMVEIMSFTQLSKLFYSITESGQHFILKDVNKTRNTHFDPETICNWLHCFSILRNTCAHYGRIYNTILHPKIRLGPKTLRHYPELQPDSLFAYIVALLRFIPDKALISFFRENLIQHIKNYRDDIHLGLLGFPEQWEQLLYDPQLIDC